MKTEYFIIGLIALAIIFFLSRNKLRKKDSAASRIVEPYRSIIIALALATVVVIFTNLYDSSFLNLNLVKIAKGFNLLLLLFLVYSVWKRKQV